jgi:uncharacterized alpha/beta hydrolase family protein
MFYKPSDKVVPVLLIHFSGGSSEDYKEILNMLLLNYQIQEDAIGRHVTRAGEMRNTHKVLLVAVF